MSSLLKKGLFGRARERLYEDEIVNSGKDPYIYHLSSQQQVLNISIKDSTGEPAYLSQLSNDETGFSHYMCSYTRLRNEAGREIIAYGWDNSTSTITLSTAKQMKKYAVWYCPI